MLEFAHLLRSIGGRPWESRTRGRVDAMSLFAASLFVVSLAAWIVMQVLVKVLAVAMPLAVVVAMLARRRHLYRPRPGTPPGEPDEDRPESPDPR